jgi:hypothetical protein
VIAAHRHDWLLGLQLQAARIAGQQLVATQKAQAGDDLG